MLYEIDNKKPKIDSSVFIQDGAKIEGNVILKENVTVWYNATIRGDIESITVDKNTSIQELSSLHCDYNSPIEIGQNVTIGHCSVIHGATVCDNVLVGMGAIILNDAIIPSNSIVAAGSVVIPNSTFEPGTMIVGSPAKSIRKLTIEEEALIREKTELYKELRLKHEDINNYKKIDR